MSARPTDAPTPRPRRTLIRAITASVLVTALIIGALSFSIGRLSTIVDATPETTSAEAGFARDMQEHHNQGV